MQQRSSGGIGACGLLIATFGAANLGGNVLAGVLRLPVPSQSRLAWATAGVAFITMALTRDPLLLLASTVLAGLATPIANVTVDVVLAHELDARDLPGAYGLQRSLVAAAGIGGLAVLGLVGSAVGPSGVLAVGGLRMVVPVLAHLVRSRLRFHRC